MVVEGSDDEHVMYALLMAHNVPKTFTVEKAGSVEKLLESIPTRLKASDLERFAVVLDADEDIQSRWDSLKHSLISSGCVGIPDSPAPKGTIGQVEGGPKVGAWIMPDNNLPGMLESFLSFLVPKHDKLLPHVDAFIEGIPPEIRRCPECRAPKARIHTWLAQQEEPGKPLGQAITATYLDAQLEVVRPFLDWVRAILVD